MPRPVSRTYLPFYTTLKAIAANEEEPTPLRLRACELCIALRSGEWAVATGNKTATRAVRKITAADSVDAELLRLSGLIAELKRETEHVVRSVETPEQRRDREINALIERAAQERKDAQ